MKVLPEVQQAVDNQGIKLIKGTTDKACHIYNQLSNSVKVVAALHITCWVAGHVLFINDIDVI